jgi:hypothetical protein
MELIEDPEKAYRELEKRKIEKRRGYILLAIPSILLVIYPFVLFADLMAILAHKGPGSSIKDFWSMNMLILITITYPLTIIYSFKKYRNDWSIKHTRYPYIHLAVILTLLLLVM